VANSIKNYTFLILAFLLSVIFAYMLYNNLAKPGPTSPNKKLEVIKYDLIFKGGQIIDGTGKPSYSADIGIIGEKIAFIGKLDQSEGKVVHMVNGLAIAPGFINPHSHIDQSILTDRAVGPSLLQGITTEIVGMDGQSAVELEQHFTKVFANGGIGVNYGSFIGQGSVRRAVIGEEDKVLTPSELETMKRTVEKAMQEGAFGLSTGLEYPPGFQTPTWELIELAKVAQSYGGIYSTHMRNEGSAVLDALEEAIIVGKEAQIPVNISHLKVNGGTNDAAVTEKLTNGVLTQIRVAQKEGLEVFADLYPYTTTYFKVNVPLLEVYGNFPEHTIFISRSSTKEFLDKSLTDIAKSRNMSVKQVVEILKQEPRVRAYVQNLSQESMNRFIKQNYVMIGVDAPTEAPKGVPDKELRIHPRRYGTYPRVLGRFVREEQILSLEEAVRRMSGLTAEKYKILNRGKVKEGFFADLVVFSPEEITDRATFSEPTLPPKGIKFVVVNGKVAVEEGKLTGVRAGKAVKGASINRSP